jgi:hypothetical protein
MNARNDLDKRREALKQEISTLKEAITDIDTPRQRAQKRDELQRLRTFLATRERELNDVEAQLAR